MLLKGQFSSISLAFLLISVLSQFSGRSFFFGFVCVRTVYVICCNIFLFNSGDEPISVKNSTGGDLKKRLSGNNM